MDNQEKQLIQIFHRIEMYRQETISRQMILQAEINKELQMLSMFEDLLSDIKQDVFKNEP